MDNGVMLSGHAPSVPQYNGRGQPQSSEGQMYPKRNSSTASSSYSTSEQQPYSSNNYSPTSQGASFSNMAIAAVGANAIRIKAAFNGNVFISSIEYNYTLEELVDHIQSICGIQPVAPHEKNDSASFPHLAGDVDTSSCTIKWIDEDGDPCTIESDHELKEALRQFHVNKDNEIRLYVFASKPNRPGEPCEGEVKDIYRRGARRWRRLYKINGHSFAAKRFGKRALCFICRDVIWGLGRQGFRCIECKIMVHKKCHKRVSFTCGESYDTITRSLPTQKRETEDLSGSFMASTTGRPTTAGKQNGSSSASASLVPPAGTPSKRGGAVGDVADGALLHTPQHHLKVSSIGGSPTPVPEAKTSSSSAFCISLADFHLLKVIGRGSFAKVLLAEYRNTGKKYAMKVIKKESIHDDEDIDCVQTEKNVFEIATNHPFLVGLHSCFQTPSRLIFVIEFVSGGDLMFHMQRQKKLPEEHGRFYAAEICSALHFLHDKGIIYRDLKLDNVLLDNEGHVKLTDYGMCKENMGYYDTTGTFCGTPNYIAPELLTGGEYGFSVDWWALGVLTYEMLAGRSPFDLLNVDNVQNTEEYLFQIILQKPIRIPRSLSPKASAVLKGFLNKNPTDRLGCDPAEGFAHIQNHPFFRPIDWEKLERKQIEPPFKPTVEDDYEDYLNNFDTQFTDEPVQFTPDKTTGSTDTIDQSEFEGFDYVNPLLMSSEDNV